MRFPHFNPTFFMKNALLSIVSIVFLLAACTQDGLINPNPTALTPSAPSVQGNSSQSILTIVDQYGTHTLNLSNIEQGNFASTPGTVTVNNTVHAATVTMSNAYLEGICAEAIGENSYTIHGINQNSDIATFDVTPTGGNEVEFDYTLNGQTTSGTISGGTIPSLLLEIPTEPSCRSGSSARWIPFAIAAVTAAVTIACGIANSNASSDCAAVAANCPNGVDEYEFEGGVCGNGDCNVVCSNP